MYTSALREQVICINDTDFCRGSTKHYFKGAIQCIHTMFPEAACFKVRITSTVSFDLSVRHDECDDGGNAGGDFVRRSICFSVCFRIGEVTVNEYWFSLTDGMNWIYQTNEYRENSVTISASASPAFTHCKNISHHVLCSCLNRGRFMQLVSVLYIYIFFFFFWASHQFLSRTVGCMWSEDASYILAFIKKGNF